MSDYLDRYEQIAQLPEPERQREMNTLFLEAATGKCVSKETEPGIYEHTFTPPYWTSTHATDTMTAGELLRIAQGIEDQRTQVDEMSEMAELAGTLSLNALSRVLDDMYANARENSLSVLISVETARRIRHLYHECQMYRVHPIPRRKLRKCHMRKVHAAWRRGRAHIRRVEQAERAGEEMLMARMKEANQ